MNVNTLTRFLFLSFILFIIFTACHKKKKPFLLLPLMDNASVSGGSGGSGPIFIPARGEIDSSFASNGIFLKDFNSGSSSDAESVNAILVQPDGKILLGGSCGDNGFANANFCIARLNSDGTLDTSFGSGGYVIQDIPTSDEDNGYSLALQPDGKILLGGSCRISGAYQFCIARFNSDGSLDTTSFGSPNGYVIQDVGTNDDYGYSLALQPDGKILLGGSCFDGVSTQFCIARFNSNGQLDTSFGFPNDYVTQDISSSPATNDYGNSLALQPDGKILLGGYCGGSAQFCIARFNSDGSLDTTSFGSPNGYVIQDISSSTSDFGNSLVLQPDGKILLGGNCFVGGSAQFCKARFNSDGSLDTTSFGSPNGYVIQDVGTNDDYGYSLALQPDGKILMMGNCINSSNYAEFCIARFNSNGQLDTSFASPNGYMMLSITGNDYSNAIAVQPDGRILIGGQCYQSSDESDFCVARIQ